MNLQRQVGLNIRRLRVARKIPQQEIAFDAGMSLTYLSNIELGKANPSVSVLGRIADALGVHAREFFAPVSAKEALPKNLKRGRNVHHQGRKPGKGRNR